MAEEPRPIVIRGVGIPRLRRIGVLATLGLLLLGWGLFALGRAGFGFGDTGVFSDAASLRRAVDARDATINQLRRQVAELDTLKAAQEQERREVAETIGELQAEVARQRQQLEFYKGVVGAAEAPPEVAIRNLRIDGPQTGSTPMLRLSLAQPGNPRNTVAGRVGVTLEGLQAGRAVRLPLFEIPYSFRYFENIERELAVPRGVTAERLAIEIQPADRGARPVVQSIPWPQSRP